MPWTEIAHTADWSIRVTAPTFDELLAEAARGMYSLMHLELDREVELSRDVEIDGIDRETQLVAFLDELLFCLGHFREAYDDFEIERDDDVVRARLVGCSVAGQSKEIKAVTFHDLAVEESPDGFEATVVFDV